MHLLLALPAPAKLNLFLHVTGRRVDGYHELQTAYTLIDLADWLDGLCFHGGCRWYQDRGSGSEGGRDQVHHDHFARE